MSLNSLANPLSGLALQPRTLNFPTNGATNSPYWDVEQQYYKNDMVISPIDQGAYVWLGESTNSGAESVSNTIMGGDDPSAQTGWWYSCTTLGVPASSQQTTLAVSVTNAASAQAAKTVAAGATLTAGQGSTWLVNWSATLTPAGAWTAPDYVNFTFTASGTAASTAVVVMAQPAVNAVLTTVPVGVSGSAVLTLGTNVNPLLSETITPSIVSPSASQQISVSVFNVLYTLVTPASLA